MLSSKSSLGFFIGQPSLLSLQLPTGHDSGVPCRLGMEELPPRCNHKNKRVRKEHIAEMAF
jgi:hypothetical protein